MTQTINDYSIFIKGEDVDLCIPNSHAIEVDGWAEWFNDTKITRFLDQGLFPNTRENQKLFLESLNNQDRIALMVRPRGKEQVIGIVSLSNINFVHRIADIAIVLGETPKGRNLQALEALALLTQHGFDNLGLMRIAAGQVYPELSNWNKRMELIGYKAEGILRSKFAKGHNRWPVISLACTYEDFQTLCAVRNNKFWLGFDEMFALVQAQPRKGFADLLHETIGELEKAYFSSLKLS